MNTHDSTSELKNETSARLLKLPIVFAQFFSMSLKLEKRSAGRALALTPVPRPQLAVIWKTRTFSQGASSRQKQHLHSAERGLSGKQGLGGLPPGRSGQSCL